MTHQLNTTTDIGQVTLEKAIIGAVLLNPDAIGQLAGVLTAEDFSQAKNRIIWETIEKLHTESRPVDLIILQSELDDSKQLGAVGGIDYLTQCVEICECSYNLPEYVSILRERSVKRAIFQAVRPDRDPRETAEEIWEIVSRLKTDIDDYSIEELVKMTHEIALSSAGCRYKFNLPVLQRKTGGFDLHETIVLGGYPSFGKSALTTHISIGLAEAGVRVLFLTAEQSELSMTRNILANICHINTMDFRVGHYTDTDKEKVLTAENRITEWDYIIRRVTTTADVHREIKKNRPEIVIVDYLQNLAPAKPGISSHQRDTDNMGILQNMAIKEPIAMIVLSQLSRPADKKMKRPNMQSFMNTGAIEQKADIALLCWFPAKADGTLNRAEAEGYEQYEIDICKSKMGPTGVCRVEYAPEFCHFQSWKNPAEDIQVWGQQGFKKVVEGIGTEDVPF